MSEAMASGSLWPPHPPSFSSCFFFFFPKTSGLILNFHPPACTQLRWQAYPGLLLYYVLW